MSEGFEGDNLCINELSGGQSYFLEVPGSVSASGLSVVSFVATERLGEPYRVTIQLTHPHRLARADCLGKDATFSIVPVDRGGRRFAGWITSLTELKTTRDFTSYELVLEAHYSKLARAHASRIYQHLTAPEIIEQVLKRHGLRGYQYRFRLRRTYPQHAFRMQYQMDDLAWVQLLMKQEGLYSYIAAGEHGDVLNVCDDIDHYVYQPSLDVPYREQAGLESGNEAVSSLVTRTQTVAQSFLVADYNHDSAWERYRDDANVAAEDKTTYGQPYVWGTHHSDAQAAKWEAQLRHEAAVASQVVYEGESNILALMPARILHIDKALPDAPNGQVVVEVVHRGARDDAYSNTYKAIPSDRRFRLALEEAAWPRIAGTLSARVTSPDQYKYAYLTAAGYYVVRFDLDFDEWNPGGESVPLRLAKPFAGALQTGFHFPLLDGTEVAIAFHDGNPNRPYIAHAMHNSQAVDHITSDNRWLSRNVIRTQSNNKLRMEDWEGQEGIKLSTDHSGKTQLNLGFLVDSKKQKRGEGVELRTSGYNALRGGSGLYLSAYDRPGASGQQLDMQETVAELERALVLARSLADLASASKADPADTDAQKAANDELDQLKQPGILAGAPGTVGMVSGKSMQFVANDSVQTTAGNSADWSVLKRFTVAAGEKISLFVQKLGITIYAAKGPVRIQAQSDAIDLASLHDTAIRSVDGSVIIEAKREILLKCGNSYFRMTPENITNATNGDYIEKAITWQKKSPDGTMQKTALPYANDIADLARHGSKFSG
ncbi:type VI secretion system Vgr family protein [Paraburkholderia caribensis]|uniref:type VI secretion system Vgr family protein n=1 Tax=Paraburkholderia caribensis TaxID=75105 RepID=UPI0007227979|nr:type VI secretion system Vgr family protein [Paraburkholderia caribensis]ALP65568.1 type IV secretion protein Rhs [Paraburkholderia caribensis]AUT55511.1 type VI secretion system tip protein VgrG [Paraburkholderia caribensis]